MSNRKHGVDKSMSGQEGLFDNLLPEGALDVSLVFRHNLTKAISFSGKDRYAVAAEISRLTKTSISKDMLDKYTSSNLEYGLRAELLPAFCHVTRGLTPFNLLLEPLDAEVLDPRDRDLIDLARLQEKEREIQAQILAIRSRRGLNR